ncbi:hypothetical protein GC177_06380 [bacterium]|nr:hypothetical protein [bacterium]
MDIIFATIEHYDGLGRELEAMFAALARQDIAARAESLWDIEKLPPCPVVLQATGGYHLELPRYLATLEKLQRLGFTLINPCETVRWNSDKHYLKELETKGHAVIPTVWLEWQMPVQWDMLWNEIGSDRMVIKPTISAGAHETQSVSKGDENHYRSWLITQLETHAMMAQPFAPEIEEEGEWSFLFFNNELSHTVLKTAKQSDYRVQHVHGGRYQHIMEPPAQLLADATRILADLPANHYARIDGIQRNGRLLLMEVELIEPYLYLLPYQQNVERAAAAIAMAARQHLSLAA